jgi:hypothetical protein
MKFIIYLSLLITMLRVLTSMEDIKIELDYFISDWNNEIDFNNYKKMNNIPIKAMITYIPNDPQKKDFTDEEFKIRTVNLNLRSEEAILLDQLGILDGNILTLCSFWIHHPIEVSGNFVGIKYRNVYDYNMASYFAFVLKADTSENAELIANYLTVLNSVYPFDVDGSCEIINVKQKKKPCKKSWWRKGKSDNAVEMNDMVSNGQNELGNGHMKTASQRFVSRVKRAFHNPKKDNIDEVELSNLRFTSPDNKESEYDRYDRYLSASGGL